METISGHEHPISTIFSKDFEFEIPVYQRPYSWTIEESEELLDDLLDFMNRRQSDGSKDPYFLGSIVLIKSSNEPKAQVIDGQQRLTTLTLLLVAIIDKIGGEEARSLKKYINEPGDLAEDRQPLPRLTLRERDREFFHTYIHTSGQLVKLNELNDRNLSDPRKNIRDNVSLFVNRLKDLDNNAAFDLAKYIVNHCYLIAVSTPNMSSAFRIFSILNDRGLDLLTCDILKADVIGKIPLTNQAKYNDTWESIEEELGREAFDNLFSHIRAIHQKSKLRTTVLEAFRDHVFTDNSDATKFMDDVLSAYAEAYAVLQDAKFSDEDDSAKIDVLIRWLLRIDNVDWIPPAMSFLRRHKDADVKAIEEFFVSLERLTASMFIRRVSINDRIERYAKLLGEIEGGSVAVGDFPSIRVSDSEKKETLSRLDGDIYNSNKRVRTYVLLRLDSFLSDGSATYEHKTLTVEHVLPQNPSTGSGWTKNWPDAEEREQWVHRLGNLVLLARRKNSQAGNMDFDEKKKKYFSTRKGVSPFALTTKVLEKDEWTPTVVEDRQREVTEKLKEAWNL